MKKLRRKAFTAAQLIFIAAAIWFVQRKLAEQWNEVQSVAATISVNWALVAASAVMVFFAYMLLVQSWRHLMTAWGSPVELVPAMRIWFVAVLGRYIPGRVWSVAATAVMGKDAGVSPFIAVSTSVLLTIINTVVGCSMVLAIGGPKLMSSVAADFPLSTAAAVVLVVAPLVLVFLLPVLVGPMGRLAGRISGRDIRFPSLSAFSVLRTAAACAAAWCVYGLAFWVFCLALFDNAAGGPLDFIEVYTASYMVGYLAILVPGGIMVREFALQNLMPVMGILPPAASVVVAWTSRLWLTVLEVLPGIVLFMIPRARKAP